jgi:hypothetical protein
VKLGNHAKHGAGGVGQNDERRDSRLSLCATGASRLPRGPLPTGTTRNC